MQTLQADYFSAYHISRDLPSRTALNKSRFVPAMS
jgi:hypothetical protein